MELLLFGLAGLGGLALLLQQKPLPSRADAEDAFDKLEKNPLDPDANTVMGKYKAFVMGDYDGAMPYLVNSKDVTLKTLAEHELDGGYTALPIQKIGIGDEWVAAAKKMPVLSRIFYDRATQWYIKAWPDLDDLWKTKSRQQGRRIAQARPPGQSKKGLPTGWEPGTDAAGSRPPWLDGNVARTGSYSAMIQAPDEKVKGSFSGMKSAVFQVTPGKPIAVSIYVMSDGTEGLEDRLAINFFDQNGTLMIWAPLGTFIQSDIPFWNRYAFSGKVPDTAARASLFILRMSKNGEMLVDDPSVKIDGKEALKNTSFEEK